MCIRGDTCGIQNPLQTGRQAGTILPKTSDDSVGFLIDLFIDSLSMAGGQGSAAAVFIATVPGLKESMEHSGRNISVGFCISLALMILLVPFPWLMAMLLAALLHEMGHLLAIRILCKEHRRIKLTIGGARISLPETSHMQELICALSGPVVGFMMLFFLNVFPKLSVCALCQSLYNLLPIYPLDGGRVMKSLLYMLCSPPVASKIMSVITWIFRILLIGIGIAVCIYAERGFLILIICILTVLRTK